MKTYLVTFIDGTYLIVNSTNFNEANKLVQLFRVNNEVKAIEESK